MTLEQAKESMWLENNKNPSVIKWQHHKTIRDLVEKLIDQIFNDHEETTSELRAEVIHQTDKVERLKEQIKANDELIKVLECRAYHAEGYINDLHNNSKEQQ